MAEILRVPFDEMRGEFERVLRKAGFVEADAALCARLFAESSRDGVASHGLNRFPSFIRACAQGIVRVGARPTLAAAFGPWEQWDGNSGPGPLNALAATDRACELARLHGMGCVGLRYTNHWMRGGSYGWRAAEAGFLLICWTNAVGGMAPWGAADAVLGNNPLVVAVPRKDGPVVLDMALTQFSHGRLDIYRKSGRPLPVAGGFDRAGNLTRDAAAIAEGGRHLPIGCWKGAGLALLLDLLAAIVSGGLATCQVKNEPGETRISQVFIAFDPRRTQPPGGGGSVDELVNQALDDLHAARPVSAGGEVLYPGERALRCRRESLALGVPVDPEIWREVAAM